jgi:hypothetical protein
MGLLKWANTWDVDPHCLQGERQDGQGLLRTGRQVGWPTFKRLGDLGPRERRPDQPDFLTIGVTMGFVPGAVFWEPGGMFAIPATPAWLEITVALGPDEA